MKELRSNLKYVKAALSMLQIEHFSLGIFDQSFPSFPEEDIGWGSPYGNGGLDFINFAHNLGINTIQFGPQGKMSRADISPYNSTIFSNNPLSLSVSMLSQQYPRLFTPDEAMILAERCSGFRHRVNSPSAFEASDQLLSTVYHRFMKSSDSNEIKHQFDSFINKLKSFNVNWFERDSIYEALSTLYKSNDWKQWSNIDQHLFFPEQNSSQVLSRIKEIHSNFYHIINLFSLGQFLLNEQHRYLREAASKLGIKLYGDMQIGFSHQDVWGWRSLFLPDYLMGAPPSRSNPEGQPWGYPVFDPTQYTSTGQQYGPALQLIEARIDKMFSRYDGIRIDHPHGLICPWVYKAESNDPFEAVRNGARLYSSPDLPDHPLLSRYAIVNREQLNKDPSYPRYGDDWVNNLTKDQVDKYATVIDVILSRARMFGASGSDILCEVLSTWPLPLKQVMQTRELGRFCVTQKADPNNPNDIYRRENTAARDWIMVGNHDTKPIWRLAAEQQGSPWYIDRANLLARQLSRNEQQKDSLVNTLLGSPNQFCEAMFSELFLGPARHVFVFFTDLLGIKEIYNRPGIIDSENWTIRIPPDYHDRYAVQSKNGEAFNIPKCLATALLVRFSEKEDATDLARKLYPESMND